MRFVSALAVILIASVTARAEDGLLSRWRFHDKQIRDRRVQPLTGDLTPALIGPIRFSSEKPPALMLYGERGAETRIEVTNDLDEADLPDNALSVEAWVLIDTSLPQGGIVDVTGVKGSAASGWCLGYHGSQFSFSLAGAKRKHATIKARTTFELHYWYHVVATYDGAEMRLYVDGRLEAKSTDVTGDIAYPDRGHYLIGARRHEKQFISTSGQLDEISVLNRALTAKEVATRFNARKAQFPDMEATHPTVTDWPTHLRDNKRTGITEDKLKFPLKLAWVHKTRHEPNPAWDEEAKHDYWHNKYHLESRVVFDSAFHVVVVGDRLYFASSADDRLRCLDTKTGRERWSFCAEGPARLAPTVVDDRVLFGSDDGSVYCLDARDGALLWDRLVASGPRRIPANGRIASAWPVRTGVMVEDGKAYCCAGVFPSQGVDQITLDLRDGKPLDRKPLSVTAQGYLERSSGQLRVATGRDPAGAFVFKLQRRGKEIGKEVSTLPTDYPYAFIGAGDIRLGGGNGKLAAFRTEDGAKVWSADVEGKVYSLAVARGRLYASTDKGHIYCFSPDARETKTIEPKVPVALSYPDESTKQKYVAAAEAILKKSGANRGYCLILGSGDARLAYELAQRSELQIVCREPDAAKVADARRAIDAAGLATRVAIHHGPLDALPYGDCLFNLIVSDSVVTDGRFIGSRDETLRVLRPAGGLAIFGNDDRDAVRRAPLDGAGEWSHMYADAANTACSNDRRVAGALTMQWFGKPGPRAMIDRHHRSAAPLCKDGRLFVPGEDRVIAVDAYNGTVLWNRVFASSRRVVIHKDCSYLAAADGAVYVAAADRCLALDPQTGKTQRTFTLPPIDDDRKREWGYVGIVGDTIVGSAAREGSSRRSQSHRIDRTETYYDFVPLVCSETLFAFDRTTGKSRWSYTPKDGAILNPTIAIGGSAVFFLESANPATLKAKLTRANLGDLLGKGSKLVALDLTTGKERWRRAGPFEALQHNVFLAFAEDRIVVAGSRNSSADKKTATVLYDVQVFDAQTGKWKWQKTHDTRHAIGGDHGEQDQHPVIVGARLYCEPFAYDLHTGQTLDWKWPWAGRKRNGCGNISASASSFFYRDGSAGMFDLATSQQKALTTETRPGCWINLIPAAGLLLAPEASSGCTCNFSVQTSFALMPIPPAREK